MCDALLVVEDNPLQAKIIGDLIYGAEIYPTFARTMDEALQVLNTVRVDVVLLDLTLPDSHGADSVRKIVESVPGIPIIVFTGSLDEKLLDECIAAGADDYLVKSITMTPLAFQRVVKHAILRRQQNRDMSGSLSKLQRARLRLEQHWITDDGS